MGIDLTRPPAPCDRGSREDATQELAAVLRRGRRSRASVPTSLSSTFDEAMGAMPRDHSAVYLAATTCHCAPYFRPGPISFRLGSLTRRCNLLYSIPSSAHAFSLCLYGTSNKCICRNTIYCCILEATR